MHIWDMLLCNSRQVVREDNYVAICVVKSGRNQTMRHIGRTHGVYVAWLHERGMFELVFEPS